MENFLFKNSKIKIFLISFFWVIFAVLFLQFIIFPFFLENSKYNVYLIFPDSVTIHDNSLKLKDVFLDSQEQWKLIPDKWSLVPKSYEKWITDPDILTGLVSLIYYLTYSHPLVLLPFNALIHGISALIFFSILNLISKNNNYSFIATLPFVFFPTAFYWNAQILKDGIFILGNLICLWSILSTINLIFNFDNLKKYFINKFLLYLICFNISLLIIFYFRSYFLDIIYFYQFVCLLIVVYYLFINRTGLFLSFLTFFLLIIFSLSPKFFLFSNDFINDQITNNNANEKNNYNLREVDNIIITETSETTDVKNIIIDENIGNSETTQIVKENKDDINLIKSSKKDDKIIQENIYDINVKKISKWKKINIIPGIIDDKLYNLSRIRDGFRLNTGRSRIDNEVRFTNTFEVLKYIPRSLQIGYLSPFPSQWFDRSSKFLPDKYKENSNLHFLMRIISGFEMIFVYFFIFFFLFSFWKMKKNIYLFLTLLYSLGGTLAFSLVVNNVGTLVRMRYVFLMLLVGIAFLSLLEFIKSNNIKNFFLKKIT